MLDDITTTNIISWYFTRSFYFLLVYHYIEYKIFTIITASNQIVIVLRNCKDLKIAYCDIINHNVYIIYNIHILYRHKVLPYVQFPNSVPPHSVQFPAELQRRSLPRLRLLRPSLCRGQHPLGKLWTACCRAFASSTGPIYLMEVQNRRWCACRSLFVHRVVVWKCSWVIFTH